MGAWVRQDLNLGMAESKSPNFACEINARSEKAAKFHPFQTKRLAPNSERLDTRWS
jgi:hypothetical protein